jgi:hypothetical protein
MGTSGGGTVRFGIGGAVKSARHGRKRRRAMVTERACRAESVAMPVLAYICRYSFEISTNAIRDFSDSTALERAHTRRSE